MIDGRGKHMLQVLDVNRRLVRKYIKDHPGTTKKEMGEALKMSQNTIRKHVKAIESGG